VRSIVDGVFRRRPAIGRPAALIREEPERGRATSTAILGLDEPRSERQEARMGTELGLPHCGQTRAWGSTGSGAASDGIMVVG